MTETRAYESPLRRERAARTRRRIRRAARSLFGCRGFAETTIAEIAESAEVSPATVYAVFESKAGLVAEMVEELEETAGAEERPGWPAEAGAQLAHWVAAHVRLFELGADILRPAREARRTPEVAALFERGDAHRRSRIEGMVDMWARAGALRSGLSAEAAADTLWLLSTVDGYLTAVDDLGWSPERYREWLTELLSERVFG